MDMHIHIMLLSMMPMAGYNGERLMRKVSNSQCISYRKVDNNVSLQILHVNITAIVHIHMIECIHVKDDCPQTSVMY